MKLINVKEKKSLAKEQKMQKSVIFVKKKFENLFSIQGNIEMLQIMIIILS